jgi:hypothetical protein
MHGVASSALLLGLLGLRLGLFGFNCRYGGANRSRSRCRRLGGLSRGRSGTLIRLNYLLLDLGHTLHCGCSWDVGLIVECVDKVDARHCCGAVMEVVAKSRCRCRCFSEGSSGEKRN